jgi:hypothetical protein
VKARPATVYEHHPAYRKYGWILLVAAAAAIAAMFFTDGQDRLLALMCAVICGGIGYDTLRKTTAGLGLELLDAGIRIQPQDTILRWEDVTAVRYAAAGVKVTGARGEAVVVSLDIPRAEEAVNRILASSPRLRGGYGTYVRPRGTLDAWLVGGGLSLFVPLAIWGSTLGNHHGWWLVAIFVFTGVRVATRTYASVTVSSRTLRLERNGATVTIPWDEVAGVRFEKRVVKPRGGYYLMLVLDTLRGPQDLEVSGVSPFVLFRAIHTAVTLFREAKATEHVAPPARPPESHARDSGL